MKNILVIFFTLFVSIAVPATSHAIKGDEEGFRPPSNSSANNDAYPVKVSWNIKANEQHIVYMQRRQGSLAKFNKPAALCLSIQDKIQQDNCLAKVVIDLRKEIVTVAEMLSPPVNV